MMKTIFGAFAIALTAVVLLGCQDPTASADVSFGVLKVAVDSSSSRDVGSAKSISAEVTTVQLKLTNPSYPPILASAAYPSPGTLSVDKIKAGTWKAQVYLDDAAARTLYYGEESVTVQPGSTSTVSILVYATGGVTVGVTEGIVQPVFTAGTPGASSVQVTITLPASVASTAKICYRKDGPDPVQSDTRYDSGTTVTLSFSEVLKAITVMTADNATSAVVVYSYSLPLVTVSQAGTAYISGTSNFDFGAVAPGTTSTPAYFSIGNSGNGDNLLVTGVGIELSGTSPDLYSIDFTSLRTVIGAGQSTRFALSFSPVAVGTFTATVKVYTNSVVNGTFTFGVTGQGNTPPSVSFVSCLAVQGAGVAAVNGAYYQVAVSHGLPVYKHQTRNYWIYYETTGSLGGTFNKYVLGNSPSFLIDESDAGQSRMYQKNFGDPGLPTGKSYNIEPSTTDNRLVSPYFGSFGNAPYITTSIAGIGGVCYLGYALTACYLYNDKENDLESGTTFQWYISQTSSSEFIWPIGGETSSTYVVRYEDLAKWIYLEVIPISANGVKGVSQRSYCFYISASNPD